MILVPLKLNLVDVSYRSLVISYLYLHVMVVISLVMDQSWTNNLFFCTKSSVSTENYIMPDRTRSDPLELMNEWVQSIFWLKIILIVYALSVNNFHDATCQTFKVVIVEGDLLPVLKPRHNGRFVSTSGAGDGEGWWCGVGFGRKSFRSVHVEHRLPYSVKSVNSRDNINIRSQCRN